MRVTVPRFGLLSIALSHLFRKLEFDFLPAPSITPASWDRSLTLSPEQICLPFKYNMANYLDCLNLGVDTIFIAGGHGPCRFGLYGFLQGKLLSAVEEKLRFVVINQDNILEFIDELIGLSPRRPGRIQLFYWLYQTFRLLEAAELNQELYYKGLTSQKSGTMAEELFAYYNQVFSRLQNMSQLPDILRRMRRDYKGICKNQNNRIKIGLIGEIYMVIEPAANMNIRQILAEMGVLTDPAITICEWLRILMRMDYFNRLSNRQVRRMAKKYLPNPIGGKGLHTIASALNYAKLGYDGIVHVMPFGCMPEIVAQSILKNVGPTTNTPILSVNYDEHMGRAGLETRLEAFVDMLQMRGK